MNRLSVLKIIVMTIYLKAVNVSIFNLYTYELGMMVTKPTAVSNKYAYNENF
jgi:hypothetical protein